jgi:hypothetical protein
MKQPPVLQRLRAKKRTQMLLVGLTWYTEDSWAQMKAAATDPECFEESFTKWKAMACKAQREFLRSGVRAIECLINPEQFATWCTLNNQQNSAAARAEYVSEKLSANL